MTYNEVIPEHAMDAWLKWAELSHEHAMTVLTHLVPLLRRLGVAAEHGRQMSIKYDHHWRQPPREGPLWWLAEGRRLKKKKGGLWSKDEEPLLRPVQPSPPPQSASELLAAIANGTYRRSKPKQRHIIGANGIRPGSNQ